MAADIVDVMADVATLLGDVAGLRVFGFPPASAQPPFAFVNMPESIYYDATFGRGFDSFTVEVYVGVASVVDRAAAQAMCAYAAGDGTGIKAYLETDRPNYRVSKATFTSITLAGGTYAGIVFTLDVTA